MTGQPAGGQAEAGAPAEPARRGLSVAGTAFSPGDIASVTQTWDPYTGEPTVVITFSDTGRAKFEQLQQGRVEQVLEISVDGEIVSSPILREIVTGGQISIAGGMTEAEASALASRLAPSTGQ